LVVTSPEAQFALALDFLTPDRNCGSFSASASAKNAKTWVIGLWIMMDRLALGTRKVISDGRVTSNAHRSSSRKSVRLRRLATSNRAEQGIDRPPNTEASGLQDRLLTQW
jgi:hypothetical protein